ncbi:MAG: tRNA (adenosine(37)-N6)-threonylcarbamoyltransferase complex dimerization subunit type 1 TsaB [Trueperaceae bacterium]
MPNPNSQTPTPIHLGLDTATPYLSLALWSPEQGTLATFTENIGRDHAKRVIVELNHLFQKANITPSQLTGIGVGVGPGSYTGVRVGIATAKALAKGLNVPLRGASTLAAMAYSVLKNGERGVVAMDARRGFVYAGVFEKSGEVVIKIGLEEKVEIEKVKEANPTLPYYQDVYPDASYSARCFDGLEASPVEAIYL